MSHTKDVTYHTGEWGQGTEEISRGGLLKDLGSHTEHKVHVYVCEGQVEVKGEIKSHFFFLMKPRKQWKCPVGTQRATPPEVNSPGHKCSQELGKRHLM